MWLHGLIVGHVLFIFLFVGLATLSGLGPGAVSLSSSEIKVGFAPGGGLPSLPATMVEKIRRGDFINFAELLPETIFETFVTPNTSEKDKKKRVPPIDNFPDWVLSFALWAATIVASDSHRGLPLLAYLGVVARLARDNPKPVWLGYDTQFRQMAAAVPSEVKWKDLNSQLLQWSKQRESVKAEKLSKEVCLKWNEGKFCDFSSCPRAHHCTHCQKRHRAIACRLARYPSKANQLSSAGVAPTSRLDSSTSSAQRP